MRFEQVFFLCLCSSYSLISGNSSPFFFVQNRATNELTVARRRPTFTSSLICLANFLDSDRRNFCISPNQPPSPLESHFEFLLFHALHPPYGGNLPRVRLHEQPMYVTCSVPRRKMGQQTDFFRLGWKKQVFEPISYTFSPPSAPLVQSNVVGGKNKLFLRPEIRMSPSGAKSNITI